MILGWHLRPDLPMAQVAHLVSQCTHKTTMKIKLTGQVNDMCTIVVYMALVRCFRLTLICIGESRESGRPDLHAKRVCFDMGSQISKQDAKIFQYGRPDLYAKSICFDMGSRISTQNAYVLIWKGRSPRKTDMFRY